MVAFDFASVEKKWQKIWSDDSLYTADIMNGKNPFYNLWMFPYPSGEGLHAGHAFASTGSDIYGRFMRMHGHNVLQTIGYDSFGIHSENFALKIGEHPNTMLSRTTKNFERQLRSLGHGYDWTRTVMTSEEGYYKWTQWLFVQLFKAGLAYRKKASVNWCPSCKTVLADEQVLDGKCERCQSQVEKKELMQWFFQITKYADRLLENLDKINWPEKIKTSQRNWIGKSQGYSIKFKIIGTEDEIEVFTTRPDTLHGATFLALAVDHPQLITHLKPEKMAELSVFKQKITNGDETAKKSKEGLCTDIVVINPATNAHIKVWVANYVTQEHGTGAIMGVPAHDERDMEFATKYKIDIVSMEPNDEMKTYGIPQTHYHLRDWLISRQRYWGPPIPMIFCELCEKKNKGERLDMPGWYSVAESELPVKLPNISDYQPDGSGRGPLAKHPEFYEVNCPACGGSATRETDASDTFLDSSWYFLRYPTVGQPNATQVPFDTQITHKWLPVSLYFGGAEHAVLHLMYSRFITMLLHDLKMLDFEEPFPEFYAHGLMIKDGAKMSKSRGNVVNPDIYIEKYGADAFRLYLMFIGPMDGSPDFRDSGMEGMVKFVNRIWKIKVVDTDSQPTAVKLNSVIKRVTNNISSRHYNTAIAALMELVNVIEANGGGLSHDSFVVLSKLLAPYAPHLAEEMYQSIHAGKKFSSVHVQPWPTYDESMVADKEVTIVVQVNGVVRDRLIVAADYMNNQEYVQQAAMKSAKLEKHLNGPSLRTIFIPGKVINFVNK